MPVRKSKGAVPGVEDVGMVPPKPPIFSGMDGEKTGETPRFLCNELESSN